MRHTKNNFSAFFTFELKRFSRNPVMLSGAFLLWFLSLLFVQIGAANYHDILDRKCEFQAIEQMKVSQYTTYTQYGGYGYRILFLPSPVSVFFINSGVIPDVNIISYVDSGERLKIYHPLIGATAFKPKSFGFTDFSGIILFFASLFSLFYGFDYFKSRDFTKMTVSLTSARITYRGQQISRILILVLLLLFIAGSGVLLAALNGLYFPFDRFMAIFILLILFIAIFFFKLGSIFASLKSKPLGIFLMLCCWFILVFPVPSAVDYYISLRARLMTTLNKLEMEKLKIVMGFEKRAIEDKISYKYGENLTDGAKKRILEFYNNEYIKIHQLEEDMRAQMKAYIRQHQLVSIFFPTTLYLSITSEISSMGFENLVDNYRYVQDSKKGFFKFYMDKVYFSDKEEKPVKIESYIKGDENIYLARSTFPAYFIPGALLNLVVLFLLSRFSYFMFRRRLADIADTGVQDKENDFPAHTFEKGQLRVIDSDSDTFQNIVFNRLCGLENGCRELSQPFTLTINGKDMRDMSKTGSFMFICHPASLPDDTTAPDLITFLARLSGRNLKRDQVFRLQEPLKNISSRPLRRFSRIQKGMLVLTLMKVIKRDIYLVDKTARSMPIEFAVHLKQRMDELRNSGALVIYITDEAVITAKLKTGKSLINENSDWCTLVDYCRELYNIPPLADFDERKG